MGASNSLLINAEEKSWKDHTLQNDKDIQRNNEAILKDIANGTEIHLAQLKYNGNKPFGYEHWFITDIHHKFKIEFGDHLQIKHDAEVRYKPVITDQEILPEYKRISSKPMDDVVRGRMVRVLGIKNFSICLRNSEHVANYIFRGSWLSSQTNPKSGPLMKHFRKSMHVDEAKLINTFPGMTSYRICNEQGVKKLYSFLTGFYKASSIDYYLDFEADSNAYNILVIGPTGAGKSHFINVIFNELLCNSDVSHHSVTREISFIRGKGQVFDVNAQKLVERNIVVAETIGLCDTEWDDKEILAIVKEQVSSSFNKIDAVFVIFRADRLQTNHIKNIKDVLNWLKFKETFQRFQFVGTHADNLSCEKKAALRQEAITIFELENLPSEQVSEYTTEKYNPIVYTGFPPEDMLNDMTKYRVEESYKSINYLLRESPSSVCITIHENMQVKPKIPKGSSSLSRKRHHYPDNSQLLQNYNHYPMYYM